MSEEEKAFNWLEEKTNDYSLNSEDFHYLIILRSFIRYMKFKLQQKENIIKEVSKYIEQRKEEWNNSQNRENINSHHYVMLIKDLLEILDKEKV